jgi:hypothetical protein
MERNDFPSEGSTQGQTGGANTSGGTFGNTGNTTGSLGYGSTGSTADTSAASDQSTTSGNAGFADRARNLAGTAQERLADVGSQVRDRAGNLKETLAGALETGAEKLRQRGQSGTLGGATGTGSLALENDGRVTEVTTRVATGMEATADWLRDADLDGMKAGIEKQVKEHPGRTLLIAVGLGYLIGKAFRK